MYRFRPNSSTSIVLPILLALSAAVNGCATYKPSLYQQEDFGETDTYARHFAHNDAVVCEAARRALLSQGYIISKAQANVVNGTKSFQPSSDQHVEIAFHIVCAANSKRDQNASIFVSATQDRYTLKKINNSASLGVGILGSVSMPFGSSDDSLVRVASETIRSAEFYDRFFGAVERYLDPVQEGPSDDNKTQLDGPVASPPPKESR